MITGPGKKAGMVNKVGSIVVLLVLLFFSGCIQKVERSTRIDSFRYYPLNVSDEYIYSGSIRKIITSRNIDLLFTRAYLDSTGELLAWEDIVKTNNRLGWKNMISSAPDHPAIHLEPALPLAPWSNIIGDTLLFNAIEIRNDSINSHLRIQVKYGIMAVETVITPAGTFNDCIKMRILYRTLDNTETRYLDGESYYWFARDIGIVKFIRPDDKGELIQATIAGVTYP